MTMTVSRPIMFNSPYVRLPLWWAGIAALVAASPVSAQHVLQGRVTDTTNAGLSGVEVVLPALKQTATTDAEGYYRIVGIPGGPRRIVMRKIGFQPLNSLHTLIADTVVLDVRMAPQEVVLPTIEVTARGLEAVPAKLRGWAERRERGEGTFFDTSFLRENEHRGLKDILRRVTGFRLVRFFDGAGYGAATGTRNISLSRRPAPIGAPDACYMSVYLDGALMWRSGSTSTPPDLDSFPLHQLAAIEVYRSASEMPAQFNTDAACGVLSMWTR